MKEITAYLMFDGQCREAMTFYAHCMGAELQMQDYSQAPGGAPTEVRSAKERIMHSKLTKNGAMLMASDTMPGAEHKAGDNFMGENFSVAIGCDSEEEIDRLFQALGEGGTVTMPLQDMFWGARFGMLKDRFGINWMLNYDKPRH